MSEKPHNLTELLDQIVALTQDDKVSLDNLIDAVGHASFTPLLLIPAIAVATPLSGIPLFSATMGILIFLVSVQMLFRRDHLWFPEWLLKREADSKKIQTTFERLRPAMRWLDARTHRRMSYLVTRPLVFIPQILCVLTGLTMPFLEFVPFSSSLAGTAVAFLAFGMFAKDGLFLLFGITPYIALLWLVFH